ncbi:phosphate signaling complex protein PhoU [Candidatus Magnetaquicoccus inordinatus]|uniref:phosphate signaling complex protein PhoU n=1 Tax=Candidatus Magnetaquicoccus inordinatus TaxID=2496818 RepID=UPI00102C275D|nr:phosphate signaling complex protein PhoU [Candidatus Magnetaquicoccus inordinatus]
MPIYEEKLQKDVTAIKEEVVKLGGMVGQALTDSLTALFTGDEKLANMTVLRDFPINRQCARLNKQCHNFIVRHLPSAGHLRMVTSVIQMVMELERMGDYARTISREAIHLHQPPEGNILRDLKIMAEHTQAILRQSMSAFATEDVELARSTLKDSSQVSVDLNVILNDLVTFCGQEGGREVAMRMLDLQTISYMLERVGNRAANVCEEILFILAGETVPQRIHEILFLDADNSILAPMAEVIARKGYSEQARFRSAAWQPAAECSSAMVDFMRHHGFNMQNIAPKNLQQIIPELGGVHIIIGLNSPVGQNGLEVPFHTVALEWDVGPLPGGNALGENAGRFEEIYRTLVANLAQLMELLNGEEGV